MPNPSQEPPASSKAPNKDLKDLDVLCTFRSKIECKILDHGYIKDQWPYPNQDQDAKPQSGASNLLQSPKWGLKGHGCSLHLVKKDRKPKFQSCVYQKPLTKICIISVSKIPDHTQIKINMPDPSQEPPASSKAPSQDLKDMDALCTFETMIECENLNHWFTKDQWPYPNPDQEAKPQWRTASPHQSP